MFPARDMKRCCLEKKKLRDYSGFKKPLFMNYVVTLALTRKIL